MSEDLEAVHQLFKSWKDFYSEKGAWPTVEHDGRWPSPCELSDTLSQGWVQWQPVARDTAGDFSNIDQALETELHPSVKALYCWYWSDSLLLRHPRGPLSLIQPWNEEDFERLQQNIIGHVVTKRTLKQADTVFLATTDEDDLNVSLINQSGEVCLEYVGKEPHEIIASSLPEFLSSLKVDEGY